MPSITEALVERYMRDIHDMTPQFSEYCPPELWEAARRMTRRPHWTSEPTSENERAARFCYMLRRGLGRGELNVHVWRWLKAFDYVAMLSREED